MTGLVVHAVTAAWTSQISTNLLEYGFMRRALLASVLIGLTAPVVGIYLVQRRLALIGDGMGHIALTGVAVGVLTGTAPVGTALVAAVLGAVLIEVVRLTGRTSADVILAVLFYGGIAGGVVLIGLAPDAGSAQLTSYLFGSITTTTDADLQVFAVLAAVVLGTLLTFSRHLFAVTNDEEWARAGGLPVTALTLLLAVLTATTVVISMRVVGVLLISALMIVPNAAAQQVATSFRSTLAVAVAVGFTSAVGGTTVSFYADTPSGGTIVLVCIAVFVLSAAGGGTVRALHARRARHDASPHAHEHGPGCGHPALPHRDHVDYVHDGHRHAVHEGHYDEH